MKERLVVRLGEDYPEEASFVVLDGDGRPQGGEERRPIEAMAEHAAGKQVWVLVPGTQVLLSSVRLPNTNRKQIETAIPFALEESLTEDIERLHFASAGREADGRIPVAVVTRERMQGWLVPFTDARITPHVVCSDVLGVPWTPGAWGVLLEDNVASVRTGATGGFAVEPENLGTFLSAALAQSADDSPAELHVYAADEESLWNAALGDLGVAVVAKPSGRSAIDCLAQGLDPRHCINLLQGPFGPNEQWRQYLTPWRPAAMIAGLALVVLGAISGVETWRLASEDRELSARIEQVYRDTFPDTKRVVNPRVQMERGLAELRERLGTPAAGVLEMLVQSGPPIGRSPGIAVQRMDYRDTNLDLLLNTPDLQTLERLKDALAEQAGLTVDILSATADQDKVVARIRIGLSGV